jgi:hypothetical protein
MASHRRVRSAQAVPGHPPPQYHSPGHPPDAPDYSYHPYPQPPLAHPHSSSSYFTPSPSTLAFPEPQLEPQLYRATSVGSAPGPRPMLTVSDYGAGDVLSPTYSITDSAFDSTPLGGLNHGYGTGGFPSPYGSGNSKQFSESSYSFSGVDTYSVTTESPERSPGLAYTQLR